MVNWQCDHCGLSASDLPDGVDTDQCYEVMYGNTYCNGCMCAYEEGIWLLDYDHPAWGWGDADEDDEDEGVGTG